jgi:hypothetical protein
MQRPSDWVRDADSPPFTFHFSPITFHLPRTPDIDAGLNGIRDVAFLVRLVV